MSYTAIKFLIDRSGSMFGTHTDAIGGMKKFIADQQQVKGQCTLSVSQFDDAYEVVHESMDIKDVPEPALSPRGSTALYDAWMKAMAEFAEEIDALPKKKRPEHIIFVVITDGYENASREAKQADVFEKVTKLTAEGWTFIYLGANQDAMQVGASLGVNTASSLTYDSTSAGTQSAYASVSNTVSAVRTGTGDGTFTNSK